MKFPRNARIFRGQLDAAPFAIVFSCLLLFLLLSSLLYTPGIPLHLPAANSLPGMDKPTIVVAMDRNGRFYFENQPINEKDLRDRLRVAASQSIQSITVMADKAVTYDQLVHLTMLALEAGIPEALLATLPGPVPAAKVAP